MTTRRNPLLMTVMGNPRNVKAHCVMCGERGPKGAPYHTPGYGGHVKGKVICDRCYRGLRSGRRAGEPWARNPDNYQSNPFILIDSLTNKIIRSWKGAMTSPVPWDWAKDAARRLGRPVFVVAHPYVPPTFRAGVEVSPLFYFGGPFEEVRPDGSMGHGPAGGYKRNPGIIPSIAGGIAGSLVASAMSNPRGPSEPDMTAARELELYINNDSQLYNSQFIPIVKNLMKRRAGGTYHREKAAKLFLYLADAGAKKYYKEYTSGTGFKFDLATRWVVAKSLRDSFEQEAELGNYDQMVFGVSNNPPRTQKGRERALDDAISHAWAQLMSGVQVPIMDIPRIFRDIKLEMAGGADLETAVRVVGGRYRVNRNPRGLMCEHGAVDRRRCRGCRTRKHGRRKTALCPHGISGGKVGRDCVRCVESRYGYKRNPDGKKKVTMPIEKFAQLVKARKDPALWRDFVAKCKGYHKWSHGTWPKKVTIEAIQKPGMQGMWISFDMGREPEKTYVMPKGTKRKGAWKHPWERMPQLRGDAEAGFILTKLGKGNRLTDFLHGN